MGFAVFALALTSESTPLSKVKYPNILFILLIYNLKDIFNHKFICIHIILDQIRYPANRHVAVMVGHEGDGLSKQAVSSFLFISIYLFYFICVLIYYFIVLSFYMYFCNLFDKAPRYQRQIKV